MASPDKNRLQVVIRRRPLPRSRRLRLTQPLREPRVEGVRAQCLNHDAPGSKRRLLTSSSISSRRRAPRIGNGPTPCAVLVDERANLVDVPIGGSVVVNQDVRRHRLDFVEDVTRHGSTNRSGPILDGRIVRRRMMGSIPAAFVRIGALDRGIAWAAYGSGACLCCRPRSRSATSSNQRPREAAAAASALLASFRAAARGP